MSTDLFIPSLPQAKQTIEQVGSPVYLCDMATVLARLEKLHASFPQNTKIFYAMKANYNPDLLKGLLAAGMDGVDTVSPLEVQMALRCGFSKEQIIFTGNYSSREELAWIISTGVLCNIGSLMELEMVGQIQPGAGVAVRLKPSVGAGEFQGTITGGKDSKFGIALGELDSVMEILQRYHLNLLGLHCHIGSGFYRTVEFATAVHSIVQVAGKINEKIAGSLLQFIDCGGGFGVRYRPGQEGLDLNNFAQVIIPILEEYQKESNKSNQAYKDFRPDDLLELRLEPGKFLVAESTVLLCRLQL